MYVSLRIHTSIYIYVPTDIQRFCLCVYVSVHTCVYIYMQMYMDIDIDRVIDCTQAAKLVTDSDANRSGQSHVGSLMPVVRCVQVPLQ